jgi:signal transduction histidine kinase
MKSKGAKFSQHYQTVLLAHLEGGTKASPDSASGLGALALEAGLQTLDLAKLHERILTQQVQPDCVPHKRADVVRQAGRFFAVAILRIEEQKQAKRKTTASAIQLEALMGALSQRTVELAATNKKLSQEVAQRKAVEKALRAKEQSHSQSLEKSAGLQRELRGLSRQMLSAQEDERKKISRELHDVVGQTLAGINIHLDSLKKEAALNTKTLVRNIKRTQRLVEKSADTLNNFARELRPAVLDDLGLIPALHSLMKTFTAQTGVRTGLTAFSEILKLNTTRRTTLFRVVQEALINVARHAHATRVEVTILNFDPGLRMTIQDDGKSFQVGSAKSGRGRKGLGLLGMRERVEMIGGRFLIESAVGNGTTITVNIPWRESAEKPSSGVAQIAVEPV